MWKTVFHSFFFIAKFIKNRNDVKLNEELNTDQTIESLLQSENRVSVFDNNIIKFSVIHIYLNISLKFANKDYWETDEKYVETYKFFLKVLIQSLLEHFKLISDHKIQRAVL